MGRGLKKESKDEAPKEGAKDASIDEKAE